MHQTNRRRTAGIVGLVSALALVAIACTIPAPPPEPTNPTITYRLVNTAGQGDYAHFSNAGDGSTESIWIFPSGLTASRNLLATCGTNCAAAFQQAAFKDQAGVADQPNDRAAFYHLVANDAVEFPNFVSVVNNPNTGCARIVFSATGGTKPSTTIVVRPAGTRTMSYPSCPGPS